jgi:hypothetical protein
MEKVKGGMSNASTRRPIEFVMQMLAPLSMSEPSFAEIWQTQKPSVKPKTRGWPHMQVTLLNTDGWRSGGKAIAKLMLEVSW